MEESLKNHGSFQLYFLVLLSCFWIGGLGIWGLFQQWRSQVILQLQLDRHTGEIAQHLKETLQSLGSYNQKIRYLRFSLSNPTPLPLKTSFVMTLDGIVLLQNKLLLQWQWKQLKTPSLPSIPVNRPLEDWIGKQALEWSNDPLSFVIQIKKKSRYSIARVTPKSKCPHLENCEWITRWTTF